MGINEKCVRWEFATMPICFNKNIWKWFGKEYFSKSIKSWFNKAVITLICLEPSLYCIYCMLKGMGSMKSFMDFAYIGFARVTFYVAPELYYKWGEMEQRLNRFFWLSSQKPYLVSLVWARWWDKKMAQTKFTKLFFTN